MGREQRKRGQHNDDDHVPPVRSGKLEQRFWMYVWTIKLIVLLIVFVILFLFVRRFIFH